jgi:crossover junction endodeoxyribonuclease RuvC
MSAVLAIDPGLSGALALYWPKTGILHVADMPTVNAGKGKASKRIIDVQELARLIDDMNKNVVGDGLIDHCFLEQVGTRPGEGAVGAFTFGEGVGVLRGILAANFIPVTRVTPSVWKKALGVPAAKDGARARASELLPRHADKWTRVKDDGRAESSMLAFYGACQLAIKGMAA